MNNNTIAIAVIALVLIGVGAWMYQGKSTMSPDEAALPSGAVNPPVESSMPLPPQMEGQKMEDGVMVEGGVNADAVVPIPEKIVVREFIVTGKSFSFSPATIIVKKGEHVKITFKNSGGIHDWRLDGYGVGTKQLNSGEQETIEFVADKVGSFEYYCSVMNHRAMGMKGALVVE